MKLKSARLQNFRRFDDITIDFHDRLTVLVGGNGSGKTAVLDALDGFLANMKAFAFFPSVVPQFPAESLKQGKEHFGFEYDVSRKEKKTDNTPQGPEAPSSNILHVVLSCENINGTPYFQNRQSHSLKQFLEADTEIKSTENYRYFKAQRLNDHAFADALQWFADREVEEAKAARRNKDMNYVIPELQAVREAVSAALGDYEQPYTDKTPVELFIKKKGEETPYSLSQLSDGYRAMLVLIMDLAHHLAKENASSTQAAPAGQPEPTSSPAAATPYPASVLDSPAIVLIDEVELHLHPSWQQRVLPDLMHIFPNTQFIVTTHSPQVVSAIAHKHIRVLDGDHAYGIEGVTEGVDAGRILDEVFGVNPLPLNILWAEKLNTCNSLAFSEQWADALPLLTELEAHYGADYPPLYEMRLHVENCQWERDHEGRA